MRLGSTTASVKDRQPENSTCSASDGECPKLKEETRLDDNARLENWQLALSCSTRAAGRGEREVEGERNGGYGSSPDKYLTIKCPRQTRLIKREEQMVQTDTGEAQSRRDMGTYLVTSALLPSCRHFRHEAVAALMVYGQHDSFPFTYVVLFYAT